MEGYPKLKYHVRGGGHVVVTSPEQEKALGSDWVDTKRVQPVIVDEKQQVKPSRRPVERSGPS